MLRSFIHTITGKLANKLVLLFATTIILIVVLLTFISYRLIVSNHIQNDIVNNQSNLHLVNKSLSHYFAEMNEFSSPYLQYEDLMLAFANEPFDYTSQSYIEDYLRSLFYARQDIESVNIYLIDQFKYYVINRDQPTIRVVYDDRQDVFQQDWFQHIINNKAYHYTQSMLTHDELGYRVNKDRSFMGYHRTLRKLLDREPKAVLSLYFNTKSRDGILQDILLTDHGHLLLLDASGAPYYINDVDMYETQLDDDFYEQLASLSDGGHFEWINENMERYLVISDIANDSGWQLIKLMPYDELYESARTVRLASTGIGLLFLVISLGLVILISNAMTRPLMTLSANMNRVRLGDFSVKVQVKGRDEIALLSKQFNQMVEETNTLINEQYKMKLVEKSVMLKALEAEINPHFLYNALQAISTKSLKSNVPEITDMVDALALSLRYLISGNDMVPLRDEVKHVENYLFLQKARFGDRLHVASAFDKEVLDLEIPKLSILNLVENSIKHGLEKVSFPVAIRIEVRLVPPHVIICVKDNGPGILPEDLASIVHSFDVAWEDWEGESIGLKNLHTRLKLIYGDAAGIEIDTDEFGTEMRIIIPTKGGSTDVRRIDH